MDYLFFFSFETTPLAAASTQGGGDNRTKTMPHISFGGKFEPRRLNCFFFEKRLFSKFTSLKSCLSRVHIHTHTRAYTNKMSEALTSAGRQLLSFDFSASTDHIKDFEWSASYFSLSLSFLHLSSSSGGAPPHFSKLRDARALKARQSPVDLHAERAESRPQ